MRPKDWIKNLFVLAPIIYEKLIFDVEIIIIASTGFLIFCIVSGCIYIINDISDIDRDRLHKKNKYRPLASGLISKTQLLIFVFVVLPLILIGSFKLNLQFGYLIIIYIIINLLYSYKLKHIIIIDLFIVCIGFIIRVLSGNILIGSEPSPWIMIAIFFLALFLISSKRRGELLISDIDNKLDLRLALNHYDLKLIDDYILISAIGSILSYAIYTASDFVFEKFQTKSLYITNIFVVYGVFRYYFLIKSKKIYTNISEIIYDDYPLILTIIIWIITSVIIIN
tara:strand:+ start:449 stop:1294 length:846 start_codon:yes stop_codon:yes gene_type:complete